MNENFDVQAIDTTDTIPEISMEETKGIENDENDIVTPNDRDLSDEDVMRDVEGRVAQRSASENVSEPFVSVQYNHKNRDFTKQEAINFIQKGMHTEALRTKLEYLAKKQSEGKHYYVAVSHAAKKLVRLIYHLEKTGQLYKTV